MAFKGIPDLRLVHACTLMINHNTERMLSPAQVRKYFRFTALPPRRLVGQESSIAKAWSSANLKAWFCCLLLAVIP